MISLYVIEFDNGKRYLGIARSPSRRLREHKRSVELGSSLAVHCAMRVMSYGQRVLARGEAEYIKDLEVRAIAHFQTQNRNYGYNISPGGDLNMLGVRHSAETRAKMSRAGKGRPKSLEWAAKIGAGRRGKFWNDEQRARGSEAQKRRVRTPKEIARMSVMAKIAGENRHRRALERRA